MSPRALVATPTKEECWLFLMPKSELQICCGLRAEGSSTRSLCLGAFSGPAWRGHSWLNSGPLSRLSGKRRLIRGRDSQALGEARSTGLFPFRAGRYLLSREVFISHSAGACSHQDMEYTFVCPGVSQFPPLSCLSCYCSCFSSSPPPQWALPQPALPLSRPCLTLLWFSLGAGD